MIVLAIDSAMSGCSACVYRHIEGQDQGELLASKQLNISRGQAEHLMPIIEEVIDQANVSYDDLGLVAVTNGPGAFTGMRIAIATAKAVGLAANKPVIGVSTFSAILETYLQSEERVISSPQYYMVLLDTKRKDYYAQLFHDASTNQPFGNAGVLGKEDVLSIMCSKDCMLVGDVALAFISENGLSEEGYDVAMPDAQAIAKLAANKYKMHGISDGCDPIYLRAPEIGVSKRTPRKLNNPSVSE